MAVLAKWIASNISRKVEILPLCQLHKTTNREKPTWKTASWKKIPNMYIKKQLAARQVVKNLLPYLGGDGAVVFESNPGLGYTTRAFLELGIKHLVVWEHREEFHLYLKEMENAMADKLKVFGKCYFSLRPDQMPKYAASVLDWMDTDGYAAPVKVIGATSSQILQQYIPKLCQRFEDNQTLFTPKTLDHFLFVNGLEYKLMTKWDSHIDSRALSLIRQSVLYHLFFDVCVITKVSLDCFHAENDPNLQRKMDKLTGVDRDNLYLVHLKCKPQTALTVSPPEQFQGFFDFLKQLLYRRRARLIPKMESWVPGIGLSMIERGYTMMQDVYSLTPQQMMDLYKLMVSSPGFDLSNFMEDFSHTKGTNSHTSSEDNIIFKDMDDLGRDR